VTDSDRRFQLLMSEKEFADSQIGAFFELHVKVLTFLGAALVLLGWLYSDKARVATGDTAAIALAVVILGCGVILQGIVVYGTALGYLEYKVTALREGFERSVPRLVAPVPAFWRWRSSRVQFPVVFAAAALFAMHAAVSTVLLYVAWRYQPISWLFAIAQFCAGAFLLVTVIAEVLIFVAVRHVMKAPLDVPLRTASEVSVDRAVSTGNASHDPTAF
jgi:hypothetical protein